MECRKYDFCTAFTYDEAGTCVLYQLLCVPKEFPQTVFVKMDLGKCKGRTPQFQHFKFSIDLISLRCICFGEWEFY